MENCYCGSNSIWGFIGAAILGALGIGLATGLAGAILNYCQHQHYDLSTTMLWVCVLTLVMCFALLLLVSFRVYPHPGKLIATT